MNNKPNNVLTNFDFISMKNHGIFEIWKSLSYEYRELRALIKKGLPVDSDLNSILDWMRINKPNIYSEILKYLYSPLKCGQCIYSNKIRIKNLGYELPVNNATCYCKELEHTPGGGFVCERHCK